MTKQGKQELKVILPIPPSVNKYLTVAHGRMIKTQKAREYERIFSSIAHDMANVQKWVMSNDPNQYIIFEYTFYFPRTNCDGNNYYKIITDTLVQAGNIVIDDNVVIEKVKDRFVVGSQRARIEITITRSEKVGLFQNQKDYDKFESKCQSCSRYRKGKCSILKGTLQHKIDEESLIKEKDNFICNKYKEKKSK